MGIHSHRVLARLGLSFLLLGFVLAGSQRSSLNAQVDTSKLTTVLAELVRAAPAGAARPLTVDRLPKSAQDAIQGRRLRIDSNDAVQVYVLMQAISEERLAQLASAGATVDIIDALHRRVQARVPVRRLQA